MISRIRHVVLALLGLVLAAYGLFHSVKSYPGAEAFDRLRDAMPMLMRVSSFALGVVLVVAGLVTAIFALFRLSGERPHAPGEAQARSPGWPPPPPPYREEQPDGDEYEVDPEQERPDIVGRARDNGRFDNSRFDRRHWANSHR